MAETRGEREREREEREQGNNNEREDSNYVYLIWEKVLKGIVKYFPSVMYWNFVIIQKF